MAPTKPVGLSWRSHKTFILSTVAVGLFTDLFLYGLIIPVLPFMLERDAGIPPSQVQSYTSAMLVAYAGSIVVSSPLAGWVADRSSTRRAPFLFGLVCLFGSTALLFLSKNIAILVVSRVLQGISCSFVWTTGLTMCMDVVGPERLGQTIGTIFSVISIGNLWAPFIGGWLYQKAGILGVMFLALSLLAIDLVLRLLIIESKMGYEPSDGHTDGNDQEDEGAARDVNCEEQPLLPSETGGAEQEFKLSEKQPWIVKAVPILPCLSNRSLLTSLGAALIHAMVMGSFDATVATLSRELFDFDSSQAGMLFLPIGIMNLVCGPIIGWVVDRRGTKTAAVFAFGILVPVLVLLRLVNTGGVNQIILYAGLLSLAGIGLAAAGTPCIVEGGAVIEKYHRANPGFFGENGPYAMVFGINGMMFNAGLTIGPALAGGLKDSIGYGNMNLVLAVISGITAWTCFLYLGNKAGK